MDILRRLRGEQPEVKDPIDTPIEHVSTMELVGRAVTGLPARDYRDLFATRNDWETTFAPRTGFTHKHHDGFGDPLHTWAEKRIQAIEATCTECGVVELHSDHAGRLKGSKGHSTKPWSRNAAGREKRNEEWKRYYEAGQTTDAIAALYGVSGTRVRGVLIGMGVQLRPKGPQPGRSKEPKAPKEPRVPTGRDAEILRLRTEEHLTYEEIAAKYGVSRERVRQVLKAQGADMKALVEDRWHAVSPKYKTRICRICGEEMPSQADATMEWRVEHLKTHRARWGRRGRIGARATPELNAKRAAIAADYMAGMKEREIHEKYDIKGTELSDALTQYGYKRNRRTSRRLPSRAETRARQEAVLVDIAAGVPSVTIAAKHHCSPTLVYQIAKGAGVHVARQRSGRRPLQSPPETLAAWVSDYMAGEGSSSIAKRYGVGANTVLRAVRAANVPVRRSAVGK